MHHVAHASLRNVYLYPSGRQFSDVYLLLLLMLMLLADDEKKEKNSKCELK